MPFTRIAQHSLVQKGSRAETADIAVAERLARDRRHGAMQVAGTLSEVGDQPPLLTLSGAVLALGLATGNAQRAEALVGFRGGEARSRDQACDKGAEQGAPAPARIVNELEEAEIERQLVL